LPELICSSLQQYEEKALFLASHPDELLRIKQQLLTQKTQSDLFKPEKFAQQLEAQFRQIWQADLAMQ